MISDEKQQQDSQSKPKDQDLSKLKRLKKVQDSDDENLKPPIIPEITN